MNKFLPLVAASINGILVGATIVATRWVIDQTHPASLALLRYAVGACCLVPFVFFSARPRFAPRDLLPIALLGITQFGAVVTLLNFALQFIPSARASLLFATFPLMTMLLAAALGQEKLTWLRSFGVVTTIVGVAVALGDKILQPSASANGWIGEAAVLASAFCGAVCSVLYRPYLKKYPTLPLSVFAMLAAVLVLAVTAAGEGFFAAFPAITIGGWAAVIFIGISSGIGYYLWLWALSHTAATNVTVFLSLSPITSTVLGALLLAESVSVNSVAGLLCVALGLWLALRPPRRSADSGSPQTQVAIQ
jgi:drug/metabolite transporter (DMT)-like permease